MTPNASASNVCPPKNQLEDLSAPEALAPDNQLVVSVIHRFQLKGGKRYHLLAVSMVGDSVDPIIFDGSMLAIDFDDKKLVRRGIYAVVTPDGGWTTKLAKQSGHLPLLQAANLYTEDNFPPYIDRKQNPDPIVGRVVWVWQSLV